MAYRKPGKTTVINILIVGPCYRHGAKAAAPKPRTALCISVMRRRARRLTWLTRTRACVWTWLISISWNVFARGGLCRTRSCARPRRPDRDMRRQWLALDLKQNAVAQQLRMLPPQGAHLVSVRSLEDGPASEVGWFMFRSVKIEWPTGTSVGLPWNRSVAASITRSIHISVNPAPPSQFTARNRARTGPSPALTPIPCPTGTQPW